MIIGLVYIPTSQQTMGLAASEISAWKSSVCYCQYASLTLTVYYVINEKKESCDTFRDIITYV